MRPWIALLWLAAGVVLGVAALRIWQGAPAAEVGPPPPPAVSRRPAAPKPSPRPSATPQLPSAQLQQGKLTGTDESGQKEWELQTDTLSIEQNQQRVVLGRVRGRFFKRGAAQIDVTAARAIYFTKTKVVELSGDVTARTPDGRTLRAPRVRYEAGRKQLVATGGVVVTQAGMIIRADQVTSDVDLKNTTFTGHVVVTVAGTGR